MNESEWNAKFKTVQKGIVAQAHRYYLLDMANFKHRVPNTALILDIGCGTGDFLNKFATMGYKHVHGIEPDPELRAACTHTVMDGTLQYTRKPPGVVDVVFIHMVLHHIDKTEFSNVVDELHRVLAPGGKLFIFEPGRYRVFKMVHLISKCLNIIPFFNSYSKMMDEEQHHQESFILNHHDLKTELKNKGFTTLKDSYHFYSWVYVGEK